MLNRFKSPREIGHDLERIAVELEQRNVNLPSEHRQIVRRIRRLWSPELQYKAANRPTGLATEIFQDANDFYRWVTGGKTNG